jgi:hypothetical protein
MTAQSFRNPDWVAITLNAYRSRFLADEPRDPRYDRLGAWQRWSASGSRR